MEGIQRQLGKKTDLMRKVRSGDISVFGNNIRHRRSCQLQQRQQAPGWLEGRTEEERVAVVAVATKRFTFVFPDATSKQSWGFVVGGFFFWFAF